MTKGEGKLSFRISGLTYLKAHSQKSKQLVTKSYLPLVYWDSGGCWHVHKLSLLDGIRCVRWVKWGPVHYCVSLLCVHFNAIQRDLLKQKSVTLLVKSLQWHLIVPDISSGLFDLTPLCLFTFILFHLHLLHCAWAPMTFPAPNTRGSFLSEGFTLAVSPLWEAVLPHFLSSPSSCSFSFQHSFLFEMLLFFICFFSCLFVPTRIYWSPLYAQCI